MEVAWCARCHNGWQRHTHECLDAVEARAGAQWACCYRDGLGYPSTAQSLRASAEPTPGHNPNTSPSPLPPSVCIGCTCSFDLAPCLPVRGRVARKPFPCGVVVCLRNLKAVSVACTKPRLCARPHHLTRAAPAALVECLWTRRLWSWPEAAEELAKARAADWVSRGTLTREARDHTVDLLSSLAASDVDRAAVFIAMSAYAGCQVSQAVHRQGLASYLICVSHAAPTDRARPGYPLRSA